MPKNKEEKTSFSKKSNKNSSVSLKNQIQSEETYETNPIEPEESSEIKDITAQDFEIDEADQDEEGDINGDFAILEKNSAIYKIKTTDSEGPVARSQDASFARYLREINKFPLLTAEEELEYATRFIEKNDKEAGNKLIQSHLRLVVKTATKYRRYGLPLADLVAEGNLGLIQALKKFEPQKGFRFSTYALWWIRAFLQDYILRSWSLVKIGTTLAQKKLFFNLRKIRHRLGVSDEQTSLINSDIEKISSQLNVSKKEVYDMNSRLTQGDISLNRKIGFDEEEKEAIEILTDNSPNPEQIAQENQEKLQQKTLFKTAFDKLNEREQDILFSRQISENHLTLEELSQKYQISRERIRQIEENAIRKIKKEIAAILAKQNEILN